MSHTLLYAGICSYFIILGVESAPSFHGEFKRSVQILPFFLTLAAAVAHYLGL